MSKLTRSSATIEAGAATIEPVAGPPDARDNGHGQLAEHLLMITDPRTGSCVFGLLAEPKHPQLWERFVVRYRPLIYNWCRSWGGQDSDADDLCQTVLCKLLEAFQTFRFHPERGRFRSWLKTVARNAWINIRNTEPIGIGGSGDLDQPRNDWETTIGKIADRELFEEAICRVQPRFEDNSWKVVQGCLNGDSAEENARLTGKTISAVYMIKSRFIKLMKAEIASLNGPDHDAGETV
jgi:RNA polymerase sigma factor (sigma-70 family)